MTLERRVRSVSGAQVAGRFFRVVSQRYAPYITDAAGSLEQGGRYNRPREFAALYLGDSEETCWRELARKAGSMELLPRSAVGSFAVQLNRILDLTDQDVCAHLGISHDRLLDPLNYTYGQLVASAAREAGFEGILAPSVTGKGSVLAVFPDKLPPDSQVRLEEARFKEPPQLERK